MLNFYLDFYAPYCPDTDCGFGQQALVFATLSTELLCIFKNKKNSILGIIDNINKLFDHRIRLGIMAVLSVNDSVDFNRLKELLDVTDGNLASHIKVLEESGFILVTKSFVGKKPNTKYQATPLGKIEFKKHIEALEKLIK